MKKREKIAVLTEGINERKICQCFLILTKAIITITLIW